MPYEQDETGQWWQIFPCKIRLKAQFYPCSRCGKKNLRSIRYTNPLSVRCEECRGDLPRVKVGHILGDLTVIKRIKKKIFLCRCSCGKEVVRTSNGLRNKGHTHSCGCKAGGLASYRWKGIGKLSGYFFGMIRAGAKIRGIPFNLSIEDVWNKYQEQNGLCALTNLPITLPGIGKNRQKKTASLDRIDNNRGYTLDNIQWVHKDINLMKRILSQARFIQLCMAVAIHQGEENG